MIFFKDFDKVSSDKWYPKYRHNFPLEPAPLGLGKTEEQLRTEGILVEAVPEPENIPNKIPRLFYNPLEHTFGYDYEDREPSPEEIIAQRISDLEIAMAAIMGGAV